MLGYCEFLRTALSLPEYSSMLPKLRDLGDTYSLDNAQVCHIYRPVLAKLLALSSPAPAPVEDGEVVMEDGEAAGGMEAGETQPEGGVSAIQTGGRKHTHCSFGCSSLRFRCFMASKYPSSGSQRSP